MENDVYQIWIACVEARLSANCGILFWLVVCTILSYFSAKKMLMWNMKWLFMMVWLRKYFAHCGAKYIQWAELALICHATYASICSIAVHASDVIQSENQWIANISPVKILSAFWELVFRILNRWQGVGGSMCLCHIDQLLEALTQM